MLSHRIELRQFGIGNNRVWVKLSFSRQGVRLLAEIDVREYLPDADLFEQVESGFQIASREMTWDEVERETDSDRVVMRAAFALANEVVRKALPLKPAGVPYSDGED